MSESIQLYLNSKHADKYINNSLSECEFYLPNIEIPEGFHIYLSIVSSMIPYSFYNINNSNNILQYIVNQVTYTIIIPIGNYNVTHLIAALKQNMPNFTITYNNLTNKITFTHATNDFVFLSSSTCFILIGFSGSYLSSSSLNLTSDICLNINSIKCIHVNSNLITYNINKALENNISILCSIPVMSPPFSIIEYDNKSHFRTNLFVNHISMILIRLTDENGEVIDLNGCHWNMTLQLDVENFVD